MKLPFVKRQTYDDLQQINSNLQHTCSMAFDILTGQSNNAVKYKGQEYNSYKSQVTELGQKYEGLADWGNQLAKIIIDTRASFIISSGIVVKPKSKEFEREYQYIKDFMKLNDIDEEVPQDWAIEAEIEGKFLARLTKNKNKELKQIDARYIPFTSTDYTVETAPEDYKDYTKVYYKYTPNSGDKSGQSVDVALDPKEFVYKRFGGRTFKVNNTPSKTCSVLTQIESLDKCLYDLRRINHLFASPTPFINAETKEAAKSLNDAIADINWTIGKMLIGHNSTFEMIGVDMAGIDNLINEIITNLKIICGATGIPPHFLGFADLMKNRSTAENLMEEIQAATTKDRRVWIGAYEELFSKVLQMANDEYSMDFKIDAVEVKIPYISQEQFTRIVNTWLPLQLAGIVSEETVREKTPDIDGEVEKERIEEERKNMVIIPPRNTTGANDEE